MFGPAAPIATAPAAGVEMLLSCFFLFFSAVEASLSESAGLGREGLRSCIADISGYWSEMERIVMERMVAGGGAPVMHLRQLQDRRGGNGPLFVGIADAVVSAETARQQLHELVEIITQLRRGRVRAKEEESDSSCVDAIADEVDGITDEEVSPPGSSHDGSAAESIPDKTNKRGGIDESGEIKTPLRRNYFFPWQDDGQNGSERLPLSARDDLNGAVTILNQMGFSLERLLRVFLDYSKNPNYSQLGPSLSDSGCQDLALFWAFWGHQFGPNWLTDSRLMQSSKLVAALCVLISQHFTNDAGPDSVLGCRVPRRHKRVQCSDALGQRGILIDPAAAASVYSKMALIVSWAVKSQIYPDLEKIRFKKPFELVGTKIPVVWHQDSVANIFGAARGVAQHNSDSINFWIQLTHFNGFDASSDALKKQVEIRAAYESPFLFCGSESSENGIFMEVFTCNLNPDAQTSFSASLRKMPEIEALALKSSEAVDLEMDGELQIGGTVYRIPNGQFSLNSLVDWLSSGRQVARIRHFFFGSVFATEHEISSYEKSGIFRVSN